MAADLGVVLQGVDPPDEFEQAAEEIERLEYTHLWLTDSSLHARNPYVYLALAARRTSALNVGTAVTNPLTRHPAVTALSAATVDEVSGGRMILGIGAGDRPLSALGYQPASTHQLRAAVDAIRSLLAGDTVDVDTPAFRLDQARVRFPTSRGLPVYLSASGPRMLQLAGEIADGVIVLSGLFDAAIRFALDHIDIGARRAGRPRPHVGIMAYGAIADDEAQAIEAARPIAAWFPQTAPDYCELAGLSPDVVERVRDAYQGGEFQEAQRAAARLPEEFVRQMALAGNEAHATEHIQRVLATGVDAIYVFPLGERRMDTVIRFARCWHSVLESRRQSGA